MTTKLNQVFYALEPKVCLELAALSLRTGYSRGDISNAVRRLIHRGLVVRRAVGCYELSEKGTEQQATGLVITRRASCSREKPRAIIKRTLRDNLWAALRIKKKGTVLDLLEVAALEGQSEAERNARSYLHALCRAGIVFKMNKRVKGEALSGPGRQRYALLKDLGPKTPVWQVSKARIYDPNSGRFLVFEEKEGT